MKEHQEVIHPNNFLQQEEKFIGQINDRLARHLALIFGLVWTIWVFFLYPLVLLLLPADIQNKGFFLSSGWIQLWALPLFVYVGNKLQKTTDAQSDSLVKALTHIATIGDQNRELIETVHKLIEVNNDLTNQIHKSLGLKGN